MTLALRPVGDDDHEFLVNLHNDPLVLRNLTHPRPITMQEHLVWWEGIKCDPHQLRLVYTVAGVRAGLTKFYDIDLVNANCVLGADLHDDFRGKGLARPMWKLMLERCFGDMCLHRVSLTTAEYNEVAQHVYRALGFRREGRLIQSLCRDGKYYDQILMHMLQEDWETLK